MKDDAKSGESAKLVDALTLLEVLFDERSRPTLRSLRTWTKQGIIPCVRCGGLIFFNVAHVRAALASRQAKHCNGP